jgi:hypothetical protein
MASRFSLEAVLKMTDRLTVPMQRMTAGVTTYSNKMQREFDKVNRSSMKTGAIIKGILATDVIRAGVQKAVRSVEQGIELASSLTEVQNVVDVTFKASSKSIDKWAAGATQAFGLSELQAKQFSGTLGSIMKSSGIAERQLVSMSTS